MALNMSECADNVSGAGTVRSGLVAHESLGVTYLITVEVAHSVIFLLGIIGNGGLIWTVFRTTCLHSTTYCYLVSLAIADLIIIFAALPEVILLPSVGADWVLVLGGFGCPLVIYLRCVGRNAGSLIVMAFTVERYIYTAVGRPLLARKHSTLPRAKKIILVCFLLVIVECIPWLGLGALPKVDPAHGPAFEVCNCDFRQIRSTIQAYFSVDFAVFYITPLLVALLAYCRIGKAIARSSKVRRSLAQFRPDAASCGGDSIRPIARTTSLEVPSAQRNRPVLDYGYLRGKISRAKHQGNIMVLVGIVVTSAVSCLPLRGLFVYNAFAEKPYLDVWFLLFAKTTVYVTCAINPFLYNIRNRRFRRAVWDLLRHNSARTRSNRYFTPNSSLRGSKIWEREVLQL
ncbi:putative Thyrotropin-releasing hormone receptor [Hypsibius exemplaris]|uniref:Thyrotropin-releasing hormone receptor n=1 Tax=Hypsibius exemplaris TaxID=2072580 RepID=A0A9X6NMC2_HYPEX|nr:putative Thyrotropin-releasing hormone receptor [Hypsibius exemplaris]